MILAEWPLTDWVTPSRALLLPPLYLFHLFWLIAPGLALAQPCVRRGWLPAELTLPAALVASCLLGYAVFWICFLRPPLGAPASVAASAVALPLLAPLVRRKVTAPAANTDLGRQLALMAAIGFFYLAAQYAVDVGAHDQGQVRYRFADRKLYIDCYFPLFLAEQVHDGEPPGLLFADWRSSDRPPLQAGLFLMQTWTWDRDWQRLVLSWVGLAGLMDVAEPGPPPSIHYHLLGCAAQCAWVPAVWTLCRLGRLTTARSGMVVLLIACTGFTLVNTVYSWPKMLAGALALFALSALVLAARGAPRPPAGLFAAVSAALCFLAHGGSVFTLLSLAVFGLTPRLFPGWRTALAGSMAAVLLVLPWFAYQKWCDPPGDRLARWHIAGATEYRDRRTFGEALVDAYRNLTVVEFVRRRWLNVQALFVDVEADNPMGFGYELDSEFPEVSGDKTSWLVRCRDAQLHHLFPGLLLLNLGWLPLGRRLFRRHDPDAELDRLLLGVALISILLWVLLIYNGGTTVLHHGSYADMLLLMTVLSAALCRTGTIPATVFLVLHTLVFVAVWLLTTPTFVPATVNVPLAVLAVVSFVVLTVTALPPTACRKSPAEDPL
jgi:hypothetical protein